MSYPTQQPTYGGDPNDLSKPLYGARFAQAFVRFWKKYTTFSGRASRSEFWWWYLFAAVVSTVLSLIGQVVVGPYVPPPAVSQDDARQIVLEALQRGLRASTAAIAWSLIILVGQLAITVRRLHDANRRGWWYLIVFVPVVGPIVLLVFLVLGPDPAGQRFDR